MPPKAHQVFSKSLFHKMHGSELNENSSRLFVQSAAPEIRYHGENSLLGFDEELKN